jgi:hypothetical protein
MLRRSFAVVLVTGLALAAGVSGGKLEGPLQAIYDAWKAKGTVGMQAEAGARGVELLSGSRVSVRIAASDPKNIPQIRKTAAKCGARIVTSEGASLFAEVPVDRLSKLASQTRVIGIYLDRPDQRPQPSK